MTYEKVTEKTTQVLGEARAKLLVILCDAMKDYLRAEGKEPTAIHLTPAMGCLLLASQTTEKSPSSLMGMTIHWQAEEFSLRA